MVDDAEFKLVQKTVDELEHMIKGNGSKGIHRVVIESGLKLETLGEGMDKLRISMDEITEKLSDLKDKGNSKLWDIIVKWGPYPIIGVFLYFMKAQ